MKNFWSTFLACLLALVVANVVIGVFLVMVLAGIGTLFSETVPDVQQKTVLRLTARSRSATIRRATRCRRWDSTT